MVKYWSIVAVFVVAVSILLRLVFQYYRRSTRRCTHCFSRNIIRWHSRELHMNRGPDSEGFYRVDCTTFQQCNEERCMDAGKDIPVKAYLKVVRARWYSFRHHRYKYLLDSAPGRSVVHKIAVL